MPFRNNLSIIDTATNLVVGSVGVGSNPTAVAFDPANNEVYVTNLFGGTVSAVSGSSVSATIPVGLSPANLLFDPASNAMLSSRDKVG